MIRRLLHRVAAKLEDTGWLRAMRKREVESIRAVQHMDRQERQANRVEAAYLHERVNGEGGHG